MEKILLRWAVKLRANIHATVGAEVSSMEDTRETLI